MDLGLKDKVALVTAASRGLGRATALALLAEGAKVLVVARPSASLNELATLDPQRCQTLAADVLDPSVPQQAVDTAIARFGRLDIAIVNAPGPKATLPMDAGDADFDTAFQTTFYPVVRLVKAAATAMDGNGWGRIIIISSTSVKAPKPFLCLSAAARSASWAWAKSAAPELFKKGITINTVLAGPHKTERAAALGIKDKVIGEPEDFGKFVASMCAESTRFITGTGFTLDGGELAGI